MNVLQKLTTFVRGSARQSAQAILDANALTVFEQEIIDVETTVHQRKREMNEMIVARKQIEEEILCLKRLIEKREQQAHKLIENGSHEALLNDIANDIAQQEQMLASLDTQHQTIQTRIESTGKTLRQALSDVGRHRRELRLAKAQHVRSSLLATATHLPEQLSELETTRDHLVALQLSCNTSEDAWSETRERVEEETIDAKIKGEGLDRQQLRAQEILHNLKNRQ